MRKFLLVGFVLCLSWLGVAAVSQQAYAVDVTGQQDSVCNNPHATSKPAICGDTNPSSNPLLGTDGVLTKVVNILSLIVGVASIIVIIISGLRFILSGGDSNAVAGARSAIIYALVGVAVAVCSQIIVAFVLNKV